MESQSERQSKPSKPKQQIEKKFQPIKVVDCDTDTPRIFTQCYKCDKPLLIQTLHDGKEAVDHYVECPACNRIAFFAFAPKISSVLLLEANTEPKPENDN